MWPIYLVPFTSHNVFKLHPCCSMYHHFILCYYWIKFICINIPHFAYTFVSWWTFVFPLWGCYNNAAVNVCVLLLPVWTYAFISLGYMQRSGIAGRAPAFSHSPWGRHHVHLESRKPSPQVVTWLVDDHAAHMWWGGNTPGLLTQNTVLSFCCLGKQLQGRKELWGGAGCRTLQVPRLPSLLPPHPPQHQHSGLWLPIPTASPLHHQLLSVDQLAPLGRKLAQYSHL